jgi:hypothetical protein
MASTRTLCFPKEIENKLVWPPRAPVVRNVIVMKVVCFSQPPPLPPSGGLPLDLGPCVLVVWVTFSSVPCLRSRFA